MNKHLSKLLCAIIGLFLGSAAAEAQTLKWSHTPSPPTFDYGTVEIAEFRTDSRGNLALILRYAYRDVPGGRLRILWLNSRGKILHNVELPEGTDPDATDATKFEIVRISASNLLIKLLTAPSQSVLRRYRLRGATVLESDLALDSNDKIAGEVYGDPHDTGADSSGFYIFNSPPIQSGVTIKRYIIR